MADKIDESLARLNLNIDKQKEENAIIDYSTGKEYLVKLLEELQCPFTWKPENEASNSGEGVTTISRVEEKDVEDEEGEFQWTRYIFKLVLIYEYFKTKHYSGCETVLTEAEQLAICSGIKEKNADFYNSIKDAIFHSLLATKVHLLTHDQRFGEAEHTAINIKKVNEMNSSNKAALYAMQAAVWMEYGYSGNKKALDLINKALHLDSEVGEWLFLKGKCLGRIRRIDHYNEIPCPEEIRTLEKAAELTQKALHKVILAQSYRELSFREFLLHRNDTSSEKEAYINDLNERSLKYYRQALETGGSSAYINARCAWGFFKFPGSLKDIEKAKQCIDKAYGLAPNNAMINHFAGKIYESKGMIDKAMKHYKTSGEQGAFGSHLDLARLMYEKDNSYNPVPDFEKLLLRYKELPLQIELMCQIGAFYFFVKDDLLKAYKYWKTAMDLDPDSEKLRVHKCVLLNMKKPVNIYEVLYDEACLRKNTDYASYHSIILNCCSKVPGRIGGPKPRREMVWKEIESNNCSRSRFQKNQRGSRSFENRDRGRGERGSSNWVNRGRMQGDQPRRERHSRDSCRDSYHSTGSKDRKGSVSRRYSDEGYGNFHNNRSGNDTSYEFRGEKTHNYQDQKSSYNRNRDGRSGRDSPNTVSETNYGNTAGRGHSNRVNRGRMQGDQPRRKPHSRDSSRDSYHSSGSKDRKGSVSRRYSDKGYGNFHNNRSGNDTSYEFRGEKTHNYQDQKSSYNRNRDGRSGRDSPNTVSETNYGNTAGRGHSNRVNRGRMQGDQPRRKPHSRDSSRDSYHSSGSKDRKGSVSRRYSDKGYGNFHNNRSGNDTSYEFRGEKTHNYQDQKSSYNRNRDGRSGRDSPNTVSETNYGNTAGRGHSNRVNRGRMQGDQPRRKPHSRDSSRDSYHSTGSKDRKGSVSRRYSDKGYGNFHNFRSGIDASYEFRGKKTHNYQDQKSSYNRNRDGRSGRDSPNTVSETNYGNTAGRGHSNRVNRGRMQGDQPRRKPHSRDSSRDSYHSTGSKDRKGSVSRRYSDKGYGNFHNNRSGNDTSYEFRGEKTHNYQDQKSSYNRNRDGRSGRDSPNTVSETNYGNTAGRGHSNRVNRGRMQGDQPRRKPHSRDSSRDSYHSTGSKDRKGSVSRRYSDKGYGNFHNNRSGNDTSYEFRGEKTHNYQDQKSSYNRNRDGRSGRDSPNTVSETNYGNTAGRGHSNRVNRGRMQGDQPRRKPHSRDSSRDSYHSTGSKDRKGSVSRRYSDKGYGYFHNNRSGNDTSYEFRGEKTHRYQDQKSSYNRNRDGRSGRDSPNTVSETNYGNTAGNKSRHFNRDNDASRNSYGASNYHRGGYIRDDNTYSKNSYKSGHSSPSKEYRRYNRSPSRESCNGSSPDCLNRNFDGRYSHSDYNSSRRDNSNVYQRRNSKYAVHNRSSGRTTSSSVESCSDGNESFCSKSKNMKPKETVDTNREAALVNLQEASQDASSHDTEENQEFRSPREGLYTLFNNIFPNSVIQRKEQSKGQFSLTKI